MSELRMRIDKAYAEHGRLNIHDGMIPIDDIGWAEILAAIAEWGEEECNEHGWQSLVLRRFCRQCWEELLGKE